MANREGSEDAEPVIPFSATDRQPETGPQEDDVVPAGERAGIRRGIYLLPNMVTTGALFSGFYAIIAAMTDRHESAAIAIVIAGFLDALDGRIARMTNTQSEFGVQYDSLSDLVAFGVAPAVLMFSFSLSDLGKFGWTIAFIYMACAALRLARFNTRPDNAVFTGLASPAAAGTSATCVWVWVDNGLYSGMEMALPMAVMTVVLALLMVSNIRYFSPKQIDLKGRVSFFSMLIVIVLFAFIFTYPPGLLLVIGILYTASGPIDAVIRRYRRQDDTLQDL